MADRSYLGQPGLSRGLTNNNPLDLELSLADRTDPWQGEIPVDQNTDGTMCQFYTLYGGLRAGALNAINSIKNNNDTLASYITRFAPPSENDTASYIADVANNTGLDPNAPLAANLDAVVLAHLMRAQIIVENGTASAGLITDQDIADSINLLPALIIQEIGNLVANNPGTAAFGLGTLILIGVGILILK